MSEDKYVERMRKDFSLNDDQIIHEFDQDVISGKTTPEKIDVDVIPFIESLRSGLSKHASVKVNPDPPPPHPGTCGALVGLYRHIGSL